MDVDAIRHELLDGDSAWLRARRRIAAVAALLAAEFGVIGMRQYGMIRHLPDPPIRGFDSDAVTTSRAAYPFGVPDASFAIIGAGLVIALATARGSQRSGRTAWLDLALGAAIAGSSVGAVFYAAQMVRQKRACVYCIVGAAGFFSLVPLAARGVARAWHTVRASATSQSDKSI